MLLRTKARLMLVQSEMFKLNEGIRATEVNVMDSAGAKLGVMPRSQAVAMARSQGLDLILIAETAKPPLCRIMSCTSTHFLCGYACLINFFATLPHLVAVSCSSCSSCSCSCSCSSCSSSLWVALIATIILFVHTDRKYKYDLERAKKLKMKEAGIVALKKPKVCTL